MGDNPHSNIRISDAERELAMSALGEHLATGRLEVGEYEARCTHVVAARTRAELEAQFTDLPEPHPDLSTAVSPKKKVAKPKGKKQPGKKVAKTKRKNEPATTPLVSVMEGIGASALLLGIPGAILATIFAGMWWLFFPVVGVFVITMTIADAVREPEDEN